MKSQGKPKMRVVCFPCAGGSETIYTKAEFVKGKRQLHPLIGWAQRSDVEVLAVQPPGRDARQTERCAYSCKELAEMLLPVLSSVLHDGSNVPFAMVAHSVGTWVCYEVLQLFKEHGFQMPAQVFLSCFPDPKIPLAERPWKPNKDLPDDTEFIAECKEWGTNPMLFKPHLWPTFRPLMRGDFTLFDTYEHQHEATEQPLSCPITVFYGAKDTRITKTHVEGWQAMTSGEFGVFEIPGSHLFVYEPAARGHWLDLVTRALEAKLLE